MTDWRKAIIAVDGTHHVVAGRPLYESRFAAVLKYHTPGLAPALDASGAYHIDPAGRPAYRARFRRTFGFYEGLAAAVALDGGWLHIRCDGSPLTAERYRFCGNYQEARCVVRDTTGGAFHIDLDGRPIYAVRHRYTGDYRDGYAVVQRQDGQHSHIGEEGTLLHGCWFLDLDVFHKGLARARDESGWHHIDRSGAPAYRRRFATVEPFYNGQARVETDDGSIVLIDENGDTLAELRSARRSALADLSADMVGFWRTQTIRAAVELGVFEGVTELQLSLDELAHRCNLTEPMARRLARALEELGLVSSVEGSLRLTLRGELLRLAHPLTLAPAAKLWAGEHYEAWADLVASLRTGIPALQRRHQSGWFDQIAGKDDALRGYQEALTSYARHDYQALSRVVDLAGHREVVDAGGGSGMLLLGLLRAAPWLRGTLLERPEVARLFLPPPELTGRCHATAGDLLMPWPVTADAIVLARVLHDFADDAATLILEQARRALVPGGRVYVIEMVLPASGGHGGLLDLNMLVMTGGRERTGEDFAVLLARSGLKLREVKRYLL